MEEQARLFLKGWFFACVAASAVLMTFAIGDMIGHARGVAETIAGPTFISVLVFQLILVFTILPSGVAVWIANRLGLENFFVFATIGVAMGYGFAFCFKAPSTFAWQLTIAGLVAGNVYWLVAVRGRHSG